MLKPSNRRMWLECRFYCLPEKNKYIIKDVFLLFPLRKGDNSCEYIEKLWLFAGKRCSSNAIHVPKVKENGLLKEKIIVTKRQKCLGVSDQITFLQKKRPKLHCDLFQIEFSWILCYQDSQRFTAGILILTNTTVEVFNASFLCLNIHISSSGIAEIYAAHYF